MMRRAFVLAACSAVFMMLVAGHATAQVDPRQGEPGKFDFYVLALSWSPSFCEATAEEGRKPPQTQCAGRPFSFVVHGLWPQYERGFPEYCQVPPPRLNRNIVARMLDQMPAPGLIFHQWDKHGTCSGLSPGAYFENVRRARAVVKVPDEYFRLSEPRKVTPQAVRDAFLKANPGLPPEGIAITCDNRRLREVRICMTREFGFRECADVSRRSCRRGELVMPPIRGEI